MAVYRTAGTAIEAHPALFLDQVAPHSLGAHLNATVVAQVGNPGGWEAVGLQFTILGT